MFADKKWELPAYRAACAISATIFWYLFAHGYRFSNNLFSHDSLLEICQDDSAWQIALGRFVQPILIFLRGGLTSPWLICFCTLLWFCAGVCLLVLLLDIRHPLSIVLAAGILVCNPTLICANSAFLQWTDFYGLAFFLSVLGIWLCRRNTLPCTAGAILLLTLTMGIYQSYICVAIVLAMILLLRAAQENIPLKSLLVQAARFAAVFLLAALLYYLGWQIFLRTFHIWTADTYNGMASLGDYSENSLWAMTVLAYRKLFLYFWDPDTFVTTTFRARSLSIVWKYLLRTLNLLTVAAALFHLVRTNIRQKTGLLQRLCQALLLLLLPAGMNFICILSKGMLHTLMIYAFVLLYILALVAAEKDCAGKDRRLLSGRTLIWLSLLGIVWSNIVFANQVYLKKELQERSITSLMTRIVADIEDTDGYVPGVTPVAISGSFEASPYLQDLAGFEDVLPYGMGKTTFTYLGTDDAFIRYELSIAMNRTRIAATDPAVIDMPAYPAKGSIEYVGDILVVKISD